MPLRVHTVVDVGNEKFHGLYCTVKTAIIVGTEWVWRTSRRTSTNGFNMTNLITDLLCFLVRNGTTDLERPIPEYGLPAMRSLGDLRGATPVICCDTREIEPLQFEHLRCVKLCLSEGDSGILGVSDFIIERKGSLNELASNCIGANRERLEREFTRLLPYSFKRLLIVGATCDQDLLDYPYHSKILPKSVLSSVYAWQARFNLPYALAGTPQQAALQIEKWAWHWARFKVAGCQ